MSQNEPIPPKMTDTSEILHASTVAVADNAVLILGPSGSGKSALALQMLALGAGLIADDRTVVQRVKGQIIASAPTPIEGRIEARGVSILRHPYVGPAPVTLVVDLAQAEGKRLPEPHVRQVLGQDVPCLHNPDSAHFPSALLLYMQCQHDI